MNSKNKQRISLYLDKETVEKMDMLDTFSVGNAEAVCICTEGKPSNRKTTISNAEVSKGEPATVPHTISERMCLTKSSCTI